MDIETIETFLINMGLENYIGKFKDQAIEMELLRDLDDLKLKEILEKIGMKAGDEMKIRLHFQHMKEKGKKIM